ncbi:MAG: IS1096 element passenger TnpR family protein, partial [Methyloligellaceae bacterium]
MGIEGGGQAGHSPLHQSRSPSSIAFVWKSGYVIRFCASWIIRLIKLRNYCHKISPRGEVRHARYRPTVAARLRITLFYFDPAPLHEIEVRLSMTFNRLGDTIQATFLWFNSHLQEFDFAGCRYG